MNKRLLAPAFLFFFVFPLILLSQEDSKEKKIWEDERVSIVVDRVEVVDSWPERLKKKDVIPGRKTVYNPPRKGYNYVFVHYTKVEKIDLNIKLTDCILTRTQLIDDRGGAHQMDQDNSNIPIETTYPRKIVGYMICEIPKDATPVRLKYIYQYKDEPSESQERKFGQLDIDLTLIL